MSYDTCALCLVRENMNLSWEGMRGSVSGIGITVTPPPMGFVPKLDSHSFHQPCWSSHSPISTWSRDGAGKVFCSGPECDFSNASKSVDPILSSFAPSNPTVCRMLPNSSTWLLPSFHTSAPKIVRSKLAPNLVHMNIDYSVRTWCWCSCRCQPCSGGE